MNALILHDIRSAENVGSLFRTADAVGISGIYLSGITPAPIDRFNRPFGKLIKASLGAEKTIPWEQTADITALIQNLKDIQYQTIAIEQSQNSIDYKSVLIQEPVVFILGNEVSGLPKEVLSLVDIIAEIPMHGEKESLNVSVAGGVALFRLLNR